MSELKAWDIWWAFVRFEDSQEIKRRPVVILNPSEVFVLSLKITSHAGRNQWGEYEIIMWESAGLPKPSTIRVTQLLELERSSFDRRIGQLHPVDILNVQRLLET